MATQLSIPIAGYTFDASAQTITFIAPYDTIELGQISLITNTMTGTVIFQFQQTGKLATGGTIAASVLTLEYDTTSMADTDELKFDVKFDDGTSSGGDATAANQVAQTALLTTIDGDTSNLDVALSTRLKPADTLAGVTTVGAVTAITNALPAGNNNIGDVDIASIAAGTNLIGKVSIDQVTANANEVVTKTGSTTVVSSITAALPAGTNAIGKLAANSGVDIGDVDVTSLPALVAGSAIIGKVGIDQTTPGTTDRVTANVDKVGGTAIAVNSGNKDNGTQRVVIATDQPNLSTPLNVTLQAAATGGDTTYHLVSAGTTNATNIKNSAGKVTGWFIYNSNAAARKVCFHNTSGSPTAGASVFFSLMIPPTSGANVSFPNGIDFSTGIAITTVTGLADSDTAAVAANDLIINIFYK